MRMKLISTCLAAFVSAGALHAGVAAPRQRTVALVREGNSQSGISRRNGRFEKAHAPHFKTRIARPHLVGWRTTREQGRPLWPGARFTEEERERAIERGMRFVYRTARSRSNFDDYGSDYVWWFGAISNTVRDERLRQLARGMALDCARRWRHRALLGEAGLLCLSDSDGETQAAVRIAEYSVLNRRDARAPIPMGEAQRCVGAHLVGVPCGRTPRLVVSEESRVPGTCPLRRAWPYVLLMNRA